MTIFLVAGMLLTLVQVPQSATRVFKAPFDDTKLEYRPYPAELARRTAAPNAGVHAARAEILRQFRAVNSSPGNPDSIRLAILIDGKWLISDKYGMATYGNRRGVIDVMGVESVLARAGLPEKTRSHRISTTIDNQSGLPVAVRAGPHRWVGSVPARSKKTFVIWNTSLSVRQDGRTLGRYLPWKVGAELQGAGMRGRLSRGDQLEITIPVPMRGVAHRENERGILSH